MIVLFVVGIGIFMLVTPKYADDLWFLNESAEWMKERGVTFADDGVNVLRYGLPLDNIYETIKIHQNGDTGRMANIAAIPALMLPKWAASSLPLIMWCFAMWFSFRIARVSLKDFKLISFALIYWTVMIPWPQHFGIIMYQSGYIVSSGLALILSFYILNPVRSLGGRALIFLLSLLVGTWHEGFSVPIAVSIAGCMIIFPNRRNSTNLIILILICTGLLSMAVAPGFRGRMDSTLFGNLQNPYHFLTVLGHNICYFIVVFYAVYKIVKHGRQWINDNKTIIFLLLGGLVSFSLELATYSERRVSMWCTMTTLIVMLIALKNSTLPIKRGMRKSISFLLMAGVITCLVKWGFTDCYTFRVRNDFKKMVAEYNANPNKSIFLKTYTNYTVPIISGFTPNFAYIHIPLYQSFANMYYGKQQAHPMIYIPDELRNVTGKEGKKIDGNMNIRSIGKHLYAPIESIPGDSVMQTAIYRVNINFGIEEKNYTEVSAFRFKSEADGHDYLYIVPYSSFVLQNIFDIKGMEWAR